jgi:hypothetical protein
MMVDDFQQEALPLVANRRNVNMVFLDKAVNVRVVAYSSHDDVVPTEAVAELWTAIGYTLHIICQ